MRQFLYYFVMLSVLFMSLDAAADTVIEGHPHSDDPTHQIDKLKTSSVDAPANTDLNTDHCEHCCHGHCANIIDQFAPTIPPTNARDPINGRVRGIRNLAQAPPTPPPTT